MPYCIRLILLILAIGFSPLSFALTPPADIPDGLVWFNTTEPPKVSKLKGHFVLLHFGIYSTPNADLTIRDLKTLASKYPNELVVIGFHSAKFFEKGAVDDIRRSVWDQTVGYPIAIDEHLEAWRGFRVYALPTVILIAPNGEVIFRKPGTDVLYYVDRLLTANIPKYKKHLTGQPKVFTPSPEPPVKESHVKEEDVKSTTTVDELKEPKPILPATSYRPEQPPAEFIDVDLHRFVGEKVRIDREYSKHVGRIRLALRLPPKSQLVKTIKSFVRIFTKDGEYLGGLETPDPRVEIPVDRRIETDRIFIEAAFYYTQPGGLIAYKGLLFEIPLADYQKSENIDIKHNLSN